LNSSPSFKFKEAKEQCIKEIPDLVVVSQDVNKIELAELCPYITPIMDCLTKKLHEEQTTDLKDNFIKFQVSFSCGPLRLILS